MEKLGYEVQFPVKKKNALLESKRIVFPNNSKEFIKNKIYVFLNTLKKKIELNTSLFYPLNIIILQIFHVHIYPRYLRINLNFS